MKKQRWEEPEKRREEKNREERRSEKRKSQVRRQKMQVREKNGNVAKHGFSNDLWLRRAEK